MTDFKKTFNIKENITVTIKRIPMNEDVFKNRKLLQLQNSTYYVAREYLDREPHILPKLYAALSYLTGPGDSLYDDFKGSYNFTFELEVQKNNRVSHYLYRIYHYRSYVEFSVAQIVPQTDLRDDYLLHQPDNALFSDEDICACCVYMCAYALGCMEGAKYIPEPFIKYSDSNFLIFGFYNNEYFTEDCNDQSRYKNKKNVMGG